MHLLQRFFPALIITFFTSLGADAAYTGPINEFGLEGSFRTADGGIFHHLPGAKFCGYRSYPEFQVLTGASSHLQVPLAGGLPTDETYAGICRPPSHIQYAGYYASAMSGAGSTSGDSISETADHSNLVSIAGQGIPDTITKLQKTRSLGLKAVVVVNQQFFDGGRTLILFAEQVRRWREFSTAIRPYLSSIAAFYPLDEPYLDIQMRGLSPDHLKIYLESIADIIHGYTPGIPIAVIQSYQEIAIGYVPPSNYDWYGLDCYGSWDACGDDVVGRYSIPWYYQKLSSWLDPSKRLILVPDANVPRNEYDWHRQYEIISRGTDYARFAVTNPRVIAVTNFIYQSFCDLPESPSTQFDFYYSGNHACFRGVEGMPLVLEHFRWLGQAFSRK